MKELNMFPSICGVQLLGLANFTHLALPSSAIDTVLVQWQEMSL